MTLWRIRSSSPEEGERLIFQLLWTFSVKRPGMFQVTGASMGMSYLLPTKKIE
jgi:hypothetical protein